MSEKFDLRTASSLLPSMNNTEDILDEQGRNSLINYVLKIKLTPNAKSRLKKEYQKVEDLMVDRKKFLITKKSPAALYTQLHGLKQDNKTIEDFAKFIEQLSLDLTIAQADNAPEALPVLAKVNEKIALGAFSNGLRNTEIRTIIKARNFNNLKDAVAS